MEQRPFPLQSVCGHREDEVQQAKKVTPELASRTTSDLTTTNLAQINARNQELNH